VLPELDLGPLTLQTFGICFALSFVAAGAVLGRRLAELGKPADWTYEIVFAAMIGGLVGSRIDYLIQNYDRVSGDLLGSLFSGSGLVFFGGLVGGAVGVLLWARWRGFPGLALADAAIPGVAIGYVVGRVGCQLSGDGDYGSATDMPWGMAYPDGTVPTTEQVHPTPVFESVAIGLVTLLLWNLRDRVRPGTLVALYLLLAGTERLLIEFIRRNEPAFAGLTIAQLIAVVMMIAGGIWLTRLRGGFKPPRPA
jgi:phosphatidylglycerol:prolipoprotein diacylglycerol transferase